MDGDLLEIYYQATKHNYVNSLLKEMNVLSKNIDHESVTKFTKLASEVKEILGVKEISNFPSICIEDLNNIRVINQNSLHALCNLHKQTLLMDMKTLKQDGSVILDNITKESVLDELSALYHNYTAKASDMVSELVQGFKTKVGQGLYYPILLLKRLGNKSNFKVKLVSKHVLTKDILNKLDLLANSPLWTPNTSRDIDLLKKLPQEYGSLESTLSKHDIDNIRAEFDSYAVIIDGLSFFNTKAKPASGPKGFVWDVELNQDCGLASSMLIDLVNTLKVDIAIGVDCKFLHNGNTIEDFNVQTYKSILREKLEEGIEDKNHVNNHDDYLLSLTKLLGSIVAHKRKVYNYIKDLGVTVIREEIKANENSESEEVGE